MSLKHDSIPLACALRPSVSALRGALLAMGAAGTVCAPGPALAEDAATAALTQPTSTVEVGIGSTSDASAKAHPYDGIKRKGSFAVGAFDLRGGGRWDSEDASRWRVWGLQLGTDSRSLGAETSQQGQGRFSIVYDELQYNRSDSYQTPLLGAGTRNLTLPSSWLVPLVPRVSATAANARGLSPDVTSSSALVSGVPTAPTAAQLATAAAIQAADLPAFQTVRLGTKRSRLEFNALLNLDSRWDLTASLRHEDRNGLKALGTVTRFTGADISTIIPDLIDQSHEQITLGLNYTGDKLVVQSHYHMSTLLNNVPSMTWANWSTPGATANSQTMSSAPSNEMHQLGLKAQYRLGASTRLSAGMSYGRSTQNAPFLTDPSTVLVPQGSAQALVVNREVHLRLASRPLAGLNLAAAYKLDERDNQTPVNTYGYYDAGELRTGTSLFNAAFPAAGLGSNANLNANRPYSRKLHQIDLDADYALAPGQTVRAGYQKQKIDRWCNGTWIACVDADKSDEDTARVELLFNATDTLSGRVGLTHAERTVDYNENAFLALVPMANVSPTGAPGGSTAYGTMTQLGVTGYGPVLGLNPLPAAGSAAAFFFANNNALSNSLYGNQNRISELPGMRRYNMADRKRDKLRSALTWQASDSLTLQAGMDLNSDDYQHSVYGLQKARGWTANLDGSWAPSENLSLAAYVTFEDQHTTSAGNSYTANSTAANVSGFTTISGGCFATIALRNANNKIDPCLDWKADNRDRVSTFGIAGTQKNLVGGKLDLSGGVSYTSARTANDTAGGNYANNPLAVTGAAAGTVAAYYIAATPLPDITTKTLEFRAGLRWRVDDSRAVRVGYLYQHMRSTDYAYDGLQAGGLAGVLPTFEQAPSFTVHTVTVSYLISFQ
jgi:MtrB/PioB family decaheme-associated outer membrane protein